MGWQEVEASDDVEVASWIGPRLLPFDTYSIGMVIPTGFEAYVRIAPRSPLAAVLRGHTSTPERCWFCLWDGYGYLHGPPAVAYFHFWPAGTPEHLRKPPPPPPKPKLRSSRVRLPHRDYLLFTGAVEEGDGWEDGPNLWWPDDRAWCVAWEIDLDCALIGGTGELADELAGAGARRVALDDPLV